MTHAFRASPINLNKHPTVAGEASFPRRSRLMGGRGRVSMVLSTALFAVLLGALMPAKSRASMPDADMLFDYGFKGLTVGAEIGLSVGYLSAGSRYEQDEWRKLVLGVGIGALAGVTTGIVIAIADGTGGGIPVGYYVLRDASYGTWIGAAVGALVGALLWVDDGRPRDVLQGAAYGTMFGAVAGVAYGIIEGKNATPPARRYDNDWRFSVAPFNSPRSAGVAAMVAKRF